MKTREFLHKLIRERVVILDGATGTEFQQRGMPESVCPEVWCIEHPECVTSVHTEYIDAGADIIYTCTFGANRFKLEHYGISDGKELNRSLAQLARKAASGRARVAGNIGPTGRIIEPFGELPFDEAVSCFKDQAKALIDAGVDLIVIETMIDIQEARAALIATREVSNIFTMVSMTFESSGKTLTGTDPVSALVTLQSLGADVVGCNCSSGLEEMIPLVEAMKPFAVVPILVKPNAGLPVLKDGRTVFDMDPLTFSSHAASIVRAGGNLVGGCCGTTPLHISSLKKTIGAMSPKPIQRDALSAVSSPRKSCVFTRNAPLVIIGERINPTGKKDLQDELLSGKGSLVTALAKEQVEHGAQLLDVNVGMPGIDEAKTLVRVVKQLSKTNDAPLCIDSSRIEAIEAALRMYPGRALVNSISGEKDKLEPLLKIVARYGAMFILLPLMGKSLPRTSEERMNIIEGVFERARSWGFSLQDIVVDGLTMAVSADPSAGMETLSTVRRCSDELGVHTVLGLSNISFGLPERKWINAAFLSMASAMGLTMAIANPSQEEFMNIKRSSDVLTGKDRDASRFIAHFTKTRPHEKEQALPVERSKKISPLKRVHEAVIEGDRENIERILEGCLSRGTPAQEIIDESMIPAIRRVGELYEKKIYFLPQLIASAEAMKSAFEYLEPHIREEDIERTRKGTIILATVKGDIHDIGKNIVGLMLRNNGFTVIDLGKDVDPDSILQAIRKHRPHIVGLSALMTTTMVNMKAAIDTVRSQGESCEFLVGGAVLTSDYAESIGARFAKDGVDAVRVAEEIMHTLHSQKHP
ncbi:MAG: homocysteine S-methyltransferase family protein [Desulfomonilia bacterium]